MIRTYNIAPGSGKLLNDNQLWMTNKLAETRDSSVKEEKEEEERGKRGKESSQGALTTRNPKWLVVMSGVS
jgi:hypothetical protein